MKLIDKEDTGNKKNTERIKLVNKDESQNIILVNKEIEQDDDQEIPRNLKERK